MRILHWRSSILPGVAIGFAVASGCATSGSPKEDYTPDSGVVDATSEETGPPVLGAGQDEAGVDVVTTDGGGVLQDAIATSDATGCVRDASGVAPVQRICVHAGSDDNECDGHHDLVGFPLNGTTGNGFDDNCNGLVDEGCSCTAAGITKPCYLVPESQTYGGVPVGWCKENSRGTVDCVKPSTEFAGHWSGQCRGAQPPFADDICAPGDFNCDGLDENSRTQDCTCKQGLVKCPTDPLTTVPYPPPSALPLKVDAASWFINASDVSHAANWSWTLRGGDCDNVLPHPTFAMYPTNNASGSPQGTQQNNLGTSGKEKGWQFTSATGASSAIYPAFSLSGDYLLDAEFDLYGEHYKCSEKIQVRAPGIRAEACWDTENAGNVDLDVHMARVDFTGCPKQGWAATCQREDCYYANCKSTSGGTSPSWFPANSNPGDCMGWGSAATNPACGNPRLDRDIISCNPSEIDPNKTGNTGQFCGSENINVDAPDDNSEYAVGVKYFGGSSPTKPHVNVYCNGERVLSTGFNPVTGNDFPHMLNSGADTGGDLWKVAFVTAHLQNNVLTCDVHPTESQHPDAQLDGSNAYCVDNAISDGPDAIALLTGGGAMPLDADALCFH